AVSTLLPSGVLMPRHGGGEITLRHLAMHTSGLPRLPTNMSMRPLDPYDGYTTEQLYEFLTQYVQEREPGRAYEYSNLGYGLLGHVLGRRAGTDYETLLQARVCGPLGLTRTTCVLTDTLREQLAVGHNDRLEAVPGWDYGVLAGAGAIKSTIEDQQRFLAAQMKVADSPLNAAISQMLISRTAAGAHTEAAIGWEVFSREGSEVVMHGGVTGGYSSLLAYKRSPVVGLAILSNALSVSGPLSGVDDIGLHLLAGKPLNPVRRERQRVPLNRERADEYVAN